MGNTLDAQYGPAFYEGQAEGSARSAAIVVPLILSRMSVSSVVDVGCGIGTWAAAFLSNSIADVIGIDGDYVQTSMLKIPRERFIARDLRAPIALNRRFDLAVCLEVAEHLPETRSAGLVEDLTNLAPCVLFSAALPGQGGTNHINERFLSYWAEQFASKDFLPADLIRPQVWSNDAVEPWYRQNAMIFAAAGHPILNEGSRSANVYIHPAIYAKHAFKPPLTIGQLLGEFPGAIQRSFAARTRNMSGRKSPVALSRGR